MSEPCNSCGFSLWLPIAELSVADLGLYDDGRFPGRSLLKLRDHYDSLEDIPEDIAFKFLQDSRRAMAAIRIAVGAHRVNLAVLGNSVPHVHGHLIPRFPEVEALPGSSPWNDPRPKFRLQRLRRDELIEAIRRELLK